MHARVDPFPVVLESHALPGVLTFNEARKRLGGVSRTTFYRWRAERKIKTVMIGNREYVPWSEIERLAAKGDGT